eukprot:scaffold31183_cov31-Tisochrysis_lutea.AAC.1
MANRKRRGDLGSKWYASAGERRMAAMIAPVATTCNITGVRTAAPHTHAPPRSDRPMAGGEWDEHSVRRRRHGADFRA